jgi:2-C-methyl-D-erythritol 2,4-cyclodiphosphate synthase
VLLEEWLLKIKVGIGYDVHQLVEGRKLILGGVEIPHSLGLLGHSDADVLTHAVMDALLGAAGLGDIGRHFPDTDQSYKGISSLSLLKQVMRLITEQGYVVGNVDAVITAQRPKLAPYMEKMTKLLSETMAVAPEDINLKATTTEHLGFEGREEGISVTAVCLLNR